MSTIVVMPGGFHPFHAGHMALYQSAIKAFPGADVYVAASNDTSERPFPFKVKEKLAKVSGVPAGHFVQVKSPFRPSEITDQYNPDEDVLVFVRSEKDRNEEPKPGGKKKDGSLAYFQPYTGKNLKPFSQHAYMAYLPTVEFGPGITSATEIRNAWPKLNEKRKLAMVMSLYPATQKNEKLGKNVVAMLDSVMGGQQGVAEEVNPDVTSDEYFIEPTENVRIGDFVFNARTFTGALGDFNSKGLQIRAYDPKNLKSSIGSADFIVKKDKKGNTWLESDDTEVDDEYRGKGVATMMYAFAKSLGNDIKPSPYQSNAGGTMWKKWGSDAKHLGEQGVAESELNRFKKYVRPVVKTTPKIERTTNPAGRTTDHVEWKVTSPTGEIHRYNSKKQAQAHFDSFSKQGVAEGLLEAREGAMREVIRNALPSWPDYVIKDWISSRIKNEEDLKNLIGWMGELNKMVEPNSWKLHQKMFLTFDMLNPKTRYFMKTKRQFGARNPFLIPRDEERSANAEQLVKTNGMENLPPVIMLQHNNGLELCEGWHRTMAAFRLHPEGFYVNAWIGQAGEQGVAEDLENFNGIDVSLEIQKDDEYVDDEDYDNQVIYVTASSNGRELGHVLFAFDGEYLMPQDLEVDERYQGQGIAAAMYDYVKSKGYKIRRSGQQTDAGAGFWAKHRPEQNVWEQGVAEDKESDPLTKTVIQFYKPVVHDIHKEKVDDYADKARELLHKTDSPEVRRTLVDIFKKGKENPYIQGGIITTVGALLAGGILSASQQMGLNPAQTNLLLQAILNTVVPTVASRINGKNWADTIKYTLASAGIGTGIAASGLTEGTLSSMRDYFAQQDAKPKKEKIYYGLGDYETQQKQKKKEQEDLAYLKTLLHTAMVARQKGKPLSSMMRASDIAKLTAAKTDGTLDKLTNVMKEEFHTGGGKGLPFPSTYEQENSLTKHKGMSQRLVAMTETNVTESADYLEEK